MESGLPLVQVSALVKVFGEGENAVRAVDGIDLTVLPGEMLLVMGPSGSGKTTLLTMIGGLLRPTSGSVIVAGSEITRLSGSQLAAARRRLVGFIFQSFNIWEALNVQENVELVLNMAGVKGKQARGRARALLEERGLGHRLGFRARDLSGGEKQRLSIARALANEPRVLLADEPTANLDSRHGRDVMRLLAGIAKESDRAVIVVSHDQRIREIADRVVWLEDGRLKDLASLVRDPVCGMRLEPEEAVILRSGDRAYYFCSQACAREFEEHPAVYISGLPETSLTT